MTTIYLLVAAGLILLNAFFVLTEFAIVKFRTTRVEELVEQGLVRAKLVQHIQSNIDEYLSVCQVGITLASIGLGFVGEPAFVRLLAPLFGSWVLAHAAAIAVAYIIVSFTHILFGEQVPKLLAIRMPEGSALNTAYPLVLSRRIFYVPLVILNGSVHLVLKLMGLGGPIKEPTHTEEELRIILGESQTRGLMSFRRLLLMENVFDLGDVLVRDVMRSRAAVRSLRVGAPWEENLKVIRESRYSRYPLVEGSGGDEGAKPLGIVHVKDILFSSPEQVHAVDLRKIARPYGTAKENSPLETLLADLQRRRVQQVIVLDAADRWTGIVTMEDVIEEIIGSIEDEFEAEPSLFLSDSLSLGRIFLGLKASSIREGIREIVARTPASELPGPADKVIAAVEERETKLSTYLGHGVAVPHARLEGLDKAAVLFGRFDEGILVPGKEEKARFLFILLTPASQPKFQLRLLARVAGLIDSEYVWDRLTEASTPQAVLEAIRAADPVLA